MSWVFDVAHVVTHKHLSEKPEVYAWIDRNGWNGMKMKWDVTKFHCLDCLKSDGYGMKWNTEHIFSISSSKTLRSCVFPNIS